MNHLSKVDYRKICLRFKEKLGDEFVERIERRIGQDFEMALEKNPYELLSNVIEETYLQYILPFEMILEISDYLKEVYKVEKFSLALTPDFIYLPIEEMEKIRKFIEQFYHIVKELGFASKFGKEHIKWWLE